ncbi:cell division protein FtsK [Streptomyces sp. 3MP-14]|uniref:Cell division protein FtsK n=1 Tax=Streptomyces mimosae TaxID=2586635 RepID=A0A5N5ZZX4_9ACTN|nr:MULTISPECIES: FtsK/SpoIIIE domain-containing protein [Streptomyces]KAB8161482.1 cell division protein FtsK [Streptomyces mimosae]KAB8173319.1 cell division protein FtsK [Streptomyces sp. 3MP-14]
MRLTLTVVDPVGGHRADTVIDADPETQIADLTPEFAQAVGSRFVPAQAGGPQGYAEAPAGAHLFVNGEYVDPGLTLAQSPLREGSVVSLHNPSGCWPPEPNGLVELRVVGGPAAGAVHRMGVGKLEIGYGQQVHIHVPDPTLPERAMTLRVAADGTCRVTVYSDEQPLIDGEPFYHDEGDRAVWKLGKQLSVGDSLFELTPYFPPDAALKVSEDGAGLDYNRPPRLLPPERQTQFQLPKPVGEREKRPLPWLMAILPVVGAVGMASITGRWIFLMMAFMSPIMLLSNYFMDKKRGRISHAKKVEEYKERKARIEKDARDALIAERFARRHAAPDPATVLTQATGPRTRLFERRRTDDDHLLIRVGTVELDSEVVLTDPEQDEHKRQVAWKIADAPVTLPLRTLGVIGYAGSGDSARALARWTVGQIAVLHSPVDVQFVLLTDGTGQYSWEWMRWLPHSRPAPEHDTNLLVGNDAETIGARVAELTAALDARQKAAKQARTGGGPTSFKDPDIVVVFDGSRKMRSLPGVIRLLREGPSVSIFALCLDDEERFLPGECQAVVIAEPNPDRATQGGTRRPGFATGFHTFLAVPGSAFPGQGPGATPAPPMTADRLRVEQTGAWRIRGVRPDWVLPEWCELMARSLSPIRDISGESEDAALPSSSRLLDVIEMEPPSAGAIAARWQMGGQSTEAVIGESYDGAFAIDLRRDGPHGLIAGTTGSGKSELLQTIVASLAVANTPENMTFVLVDYKGGSAFKDCVQLPHTVGMVTDLDNHLVERALSSLGAELTRREHMLADVGAKDIEDYQDLMRRNPGRLPALPRLLIVIDEFASMVRELPDFVKGLVNIAQRGRSLGIHLLLATQRPSGVVSPEIRANTNLRIALRVTDGSESSDVIDAPDAGFIAKSTPGRAYVRLGHASLVPFQSGRVGGRRPGAVDPTVSRPWSGQLEWNNLGRAALKKPPGAKSQEEEITDLKVLVDAVIEADRQLGFAKQHSPWLPALGDTVLLRDLEHPAPQGALPAAPYGVEDLPSQQARRSVAIDFRSFGHMLVGGAPRSGRSQLLRTMAGSLSWIHSTADVHIYGIDCGNGALNALTRLPNCGAVVTRNQVERVRRLIRRFRQEMDRRQEVLAADALADINEQRAAAEPDKRLPHLVVLVDRWEGWVSTLGEIDHGALTDEMFVMMREGASVGIHVIIAGDRSVLSGRISTLTEERYAMRLSDRSDYSNIGMPARKVPEEVADGRMFRNQALTEIQIAVLAEELSGQAQAAALGAIGDWATERDAAVPRSRRPFRVDVLPSRLTFADAWEMRDPDASNSRLWGLIGVGGDELMGYGPDLAQGTPAFIVAGPPKSGRSTVLTMLAKSYLAQGVRVVVAAPRPSPLRDLAGQDGVIQVFTGDDLYEKDLREAVSTSSVENPIVVLVDDGEDLRRCDAADELKALVTQGSQLGRYLVLGGDEGEICGGFSGWQVDAKKARRGALLSPTTHRSGDLIGAKLPRSAAAEQPTPGRAILHLGDGTAFSVTTPAP